MDFAIEDLPPMGVLIRALLDSSRLTTTFEPPVPSSNVSLPSRGRGRSSPLLASTFHLSSYYHRLLTSYSHMNPPQHFHPQLYDVAQHAPHGEASLTTYTDHWQTQHYQRKRPKYTRSKTGCLTCRRKKVKVRRSSSSICNVSLTSQPV